jgi:hypothetical protein
MYHIYICYIYMHTNIFIAKEEMLITITILTTVTSHIVVAGIFRYFLPLLILCSFCL